mmetsp:Transcript_76126/g.150528  ORF Transcript_76126/g.150528 Transcript_76126/m.150528 type:complete len:205 (+) Transcript_76126:63-677(+)
MSTAAAVDDSAAGVCEQRCDEECDMHSDSGSSSAWSGDLCDRSNENASSPRPRFSQSQVAFVLQSRPNPESLLPDAEQPEKTGGCFFPRRHSDNQARGKWALGGSTLQPVTSRTQWWSHHNPLERVLRKSLVYVDPLGNLEAAYTRGSGGVFVPRLQLHRTSTQDSTNSIFGAAAADARSGSFGIPPLSEPVRGVHGSGQATTA